MSSNSRDEPVDSQNDDACDSVEGLCGGSVRSTSLHKESIPRAGSFSNLDEEHEALQFPRDENISAKIDEVSVLFFY